MTKGTLFIAAVAVAATVLSLAAMPGNAAREACVDRIEATNTAAGVRTDYAGAYRTCRAH